MSNPIVFGRKQKVKRNVEPVTPKRRRSIVKYSRAAERRVADLLDIEDRLYAHRLPSTGAPRQPDVVVSDGVSDAMIACEVKQMPLTKKWHSALDQARIAQHEVHADFAMVAIVEKPGQGKHDGEVFLLLDATDWAGLVERLRS